MNYTVGGTATLGTDYTGISTTGTTKTVTFAAGASAATVTVNPASDTTYESNETVILTLAPGTGYTLGTTTPVTGTITNDDTGPTRIVSASPNRDTLTGLSNQSDHFTFNQLRDSLLGTYDTVTNFESGRDRLRFLNRAYSTTLTEIRWSDSSTSGGISALTETSINQVLGGVSGFTAHEVMAFRVSSLTGTFIAVNDANPGFQASQDGLVFLQGLILGPSTAVTIV